MDFLRRILPEPVKSTLRPARRFYDRLIGQRRRLRHDLWQNYAYDARRYWSHAALSRREHSRANLQALITMDAHRIEKGLSLANSRSWFGPNAVANLLANIRKYVACFGADATAKLGVDTLLAYYRLHQDRGLSDERLWTAIEELAPLQRQSGCESELGGVIPITRAEIHAHGKLDIEPFLKSRHSIRHFDPQPVDLALIQRAVALAISTPSVCNRQPWKVHVFPDRQRKEKLLGMQNGNRGFNEEINVLLVVTGDLQCFATIGERNQAWIDGGMFSMSLVLALHSLGLGTCCLNWSVAKEADEELRRFVGLPESEVVIMFIAVGHIPEQLTVARSTRKALEEVMVVEHGGGISPTTTSPSL